MSNHKCVFALPENLYDRLPIYQDILAIYTTWSVLVEKKLRALQ